MENTDDRYTVIVSAKAAELLANHARFLAEVSEEAARNFIDEFERSARILELFPERNPWLSDAALPRNKYRKLIFNKRYIMIYQIKSRKVYLEYVLDCRQDYTWLM